MWILKYVSIVTLLLSFSNVGQAQDIVRYRLPEGTRITVAGVTYQAFDLEEYRELLRMDVDLRFQDEFITHLQTRVANYERLVTEYALIVASLEREAEVYQAENTRLLERWTEENRLRHEAENRPMLGSWVAWGFAGIFAVSTTTLLLVEIL